MGSSGSTPGVTRQDAQAVFSQLEEPCAPLSTAEVGDRLDSEEEAVRDALEELADSGAVRTRRIDEERRVWWRPAGERDPTGAETESGERGTDLEPEEYGAFVRAVEDYAIFTLDPDGTVVSWNEGAAQIKGYAASEIVGEHFSTFYTDEDVQAGVPDGNLEAAAAEGHVEDEGWRLRADGTEFWADVTITAIRDDDGTLEGFTKVTRDMTEQREYERRLERRKSELETELGQIFGRISDAFYALDDEWRFTHLNERAAEIMDESREALLGRTVWEAFPEADAVYRERFEAAMETQEPTSFEVEAVDSWLEFNVFPSESGLSIYFRDVSERKQREQELQRFETLFTESTDVNAVLNPDGTFQYLPPSVEFVLGYEPEELVGEDAFERVHPEDRERIATEFGRMAEDADYRPVNEFRYRHADGHWVWLESTGRNLLDDPNIDGLVAYTRDVTERKERERELRRKERQFEATFEDPNILVGLLEPDGTVLDINETAMDYVDADLGEIRGDPFWETPWWGTDDDVREDVREWTEQAAAGEYVDFEADLTRPGGERYTLDGVFRPVTDDEGEVVSVVVSDRDITERKEHERRLEESERRYRTLAEHFPNGIVTLFDGDLRYGLAAGQGFEDIPVEAEDLEGRHVEDAWNDEAADALRPLFEAAIDGEERATEVEYVGRDWIVRAVPITDERGDVFAGMTMAQDITERKERERRIARQKEYTDDVIDAIDDVFYVLDEDGALKRWNESLAEVTGYTHEEIATMHAPDFFGEERREAVVEAVREGFETGSISVEIDLRTKDGEFVTFEFAGSTFESPDGETVLAGIGRDVTERVERQEQLERYETIIQSVNDGVYVVDADGHFTMVNEAYAELLEYDPEELVGRHVSLVVDDAVSERAKGLETATSEQGEMPTLEAEMETANGDRVPAEANFAMLPDGDDAWHRVGVVRDVSERRERERKVEESERRYRTLVESFPAGVVGLFNGGLEYTAVGGELMDEVGVSMEERVGNSVYDIYPDDLVEEVEPYFEAALEGETNAFEAEFHDRHLSARTLPVRDADDEIFAGMLVVQDVTERRQYERKLEESNERLEQFAYAASHDLQEPLRMVSSYLRLIDRRYGGELDADGQEFLEFAVDGADRMRDMIDGLLQYSRVDTRGDPFEPVDLDDVIADVRENLAIQIEERGAEIAAESLPTVEADESQMHQLFQNLLDNGIEYSGDEPPRIHVSAERAADEWVVSVRDEGIGIDPDEADRVFEVFQSLHTSEEHGGTGIGLALCERIVERHGGDIRVESEPGAGSTFIFTLPTLGSDDE